MLSDDFNEKKQAECRQRQTLNLRVGYTQDLAVKLNKALHYVTQKIGFKPLEEFTFIKGLQQIKLYDSNRNTLIIHLEILEAGGNTENIIFYTDDCLRDYHKYIVSGVEFINRPEYTEAGLQVSFIDGEDNCYTLLEERSYTESS